MSKMVSINEFDIVFISYDEPNADENYNNLIEKAPWAKRSHGVFEVMPLTKPRQI